MFEEAFYLAAQHERISAVTRLYAPPFRTLAKVHDKGSFQELCDRPRDPNAADRARPQRGGAAGGDPAVPRFFARAAFSRGGVGLLTNTAGRPPLAGRLPSDRGESLAGPGVRGWADALHLPALHDGRVASHMAYGRRGSGSTRPDPVPLRRSVGHARNRRAARPELSWDGQIARLHRDGRGAGDDRVQPAADRRRPADDPEELERGLLGPEEETLLIPPGREEQLDFAVLGQIFREPIKELAPVDP